MVKFHKINVLSLLEYSYSILLDILLDSVLLVTVTDRVSLKMINMKQKSCNIIQQSKQWFKLTPLYLVITLKAAPTLMHQ